RRIEMLQCMRMRRILAAADMTAGQANAELRPCRSDREAFLAAVGARRDVGDLGEMFALLGHGHLDGGRASIVDERYAGDGRRAMRVGDSVVRCRESRSPISARWHNSIFCYPR